MAFFIGKSKSDNARKWPVPVRAGTVVDDRRDHFRVLFWKEGKDERELFFGNRL
jgi:hypothetical protein